MPRVRVSEIPAAHLLTVLNVPGTTAIASGPVSGRDSPEARQADRIEYPACASTAAASMKPSP